MLYYGRDIVWLRIYATNWCNPLGYLLQQIDTIYTTYEDREEEAGFKRSARALREATKIMRKRKGMTLERWVNFVHIGA
jgi:hypothetical protein